METSAEVYASCPSGYKVFLGADEWTRKIRRGVCIQCDDDNNLLILVVCIIFNYVIVNNIIEDFTHNKNQQYNIVCEIHMRIHTTHIHTVYRSYARVFFFRFTGDTWFRLMIGSVKVVTLL